MKHETPFADRNILITGGTGSWGQQLTLQLLRDHDPRHIWIYSRGEHKQVEMKRRFQDDRLQYIIGDVRDRDRLSLVTAGVDYIFHLAALKHVPVCEDNPWETVQTNIIGTQNVVDAAVKNHVRKVVDVSTDKAVDPFNLYGVTKACGEKLVIAANKISDRTAFVCVRGGNVLGTNGSVVPLFKEQLIKNNEVTITDPRMSRFFMRLEEAIGLVLHAAVHTIGGEVVVMKMPAARIEHLAAVMARRVGNSNSKVRTIGIRPGEKLYEVLVSRYEASRTLDAGAYFVILPQIHLPKTETHYGRPDFRRFGDHEFSSESTRQLDHFAIEQLLEADGWFDDQRRKDALVYLDSLSSEDLANFVQSEGWVRKGRV